MAKTNVEIQDYQGNIIHPKTSSEVVDYKESNVSVTLDELVARKKVFVQNEQPETDGVWFDTSDNQGSTAEESPIVKNIRDYIDGNIKPPIDKNTQDIKTMSEKLDTGLNTLSQLSNPNLLINGDFQVWQRGTTFENVGTGQYQADRWQVVSTDGNYLAKVTKVDDGLRIEQEDAGCVIRQYLEQDFYNKIKDKKLTYSISKDGKIESGNFTIGILNGKPLVELGAGRNITINWVKLEIGEKATPFIPRSYGEELALCQRYYETSLPIGDYNDGTVLYRFRNFIKADLPPVDAGCMFAFKTQKRGIPTVKFRYDFDDNKTIESDNPGIITLNYFGINTVFIPLEKAFDVSNWIADAEIY